MRVTQFSSSRSGGAGQAAFGLHRGLQQCGLDSIWCDADDPQLRQPSFGRVGDHALFKIRSAWRAWHGAGPMHRFAFYSWSFGMGSCPPRQLTAGSDICHLHWVTEFIDVGGLCRSFDGPVVWTLHDMNPFTGGCHFSGPCRRFEARCGKCPHFKRRYPWDWSRIVFMRRRANYAQFFENRKIHVVAPSGWLAEEARRSVLLRKASIQTIPYGVDTASFKPTARTSSREKLGIKPGRLVLLFVADYLHEGRKGLTEFFAALSRAGVADHVDVYCLGSDGGNAQLPGVRFLGRRVQPAELSTIYSAADALVAPSLQDNMPNTVLEAMSCGTPAVALPVGGMPDLIIDGDTGFLAERADESGLASALKRVVAAGPKLDAMRDRCRERATRRFSLQTQAQAYVRLYAELIEMHRTNTVSGIA